MAKEWPESKIGEIATIVQNGIYKSAENYGHGHPFLRMYNVVNDSWRINLEPLARVNLEGSELEKFRLKLGDLLVSRVNSFELVGKCRWIEAEAEGYVLKNMLIRVRLKESVDSLFIAQQMRTQAVRKQIEEVAKRAIGQSSINSNDLRGIQITLPPLQTRKSRKNACGENGSSGKGSKTLESQLIAIEQLPGALLRRVFIGDL